MAKCLSIIVLMVCLVGVVRGEYYKSCTSTHGKVQLLDISNCKHADSECKLVHGTTANLSLTFVPNFKSQHVQVKISGRIAGASIPFPVSPSESCGNYGLQCPLVPAQVAHFQLSMPIKVFYPQVQLPIDLELVDETNAKVACVEISAHIVGSSK